MPDLVAASATQPTVSAWSEPLEAPNIEDARIAHTFGGLAGVPLVGRAEAAYRKAMRLKSWQYMTAVTDDLFVAFVVGTAGFASNGFVYAAELPTGTKHERFAIAPFMLGTEVAPSSTAGTHRFRARGLSIAIENAGRSFIARIDAKTAGGAPLVANLVFESGKNDEHLAVCVPLPEGRWNYTHKFAAFTVTGEVTIGDRTTRFVPGRSFGTMDFTKMYALRHAVWRWIALCGRTRAGRVVGLNLVDPTPSAPISENAAWIDGKRVALDDVRIAKDMATAHATGVDLAMSDVAEVTESLNVPLVRHKLRHVIGAFSGRIVAGGATHELDRVVGIAEDFDTWW